MKRALVVVLFVSLIFGMLTTGASAETVNFDAIYLLRHVLMPEQFPL